MNDLTQSDIIGLLVYGSIGLYLAMSIPRLFRGRFMAGLAALAFWIVALLVVMTGYAYRFELNGVAERVIATVVPGTPIETGPQEATIFRARDGEFLVRGASGNVRLQFIFDTGASAVVLRAEDAVRVGINMRHLTYDTDVQTANGRAMTAEAVMPRLAVGDVIEHDVPVLVAKPGSLHENLLGMSFLDRLESFSVSGNKLVLKGR